MAGNQIRYVNIHMVAQAVTAWCQFYRFDPDEMALETLAQAASQLYLDGYSSAGDIATGLIETYVGRPSLMVNAPTSNSIH